MPTTEAIILRLTRLTETSLIVHWFSADLGLVKTVARGAKRTKSPFNGQIDLFFGGEITFSHARGCGDLHHLREVAIHHWRDRLRRSYTITLLAAYFCQLLESAVESEHPEPELHDLLRRALDHLDATEPTLRSLVFFESELARLLGIGHDRHAAATSLADALGKLPHSRNDLVERLAPKQDFSSSGDTIDR